MSFFWNAFETLGRNRGPSPFVTWVGPAGRVELSATTYLNAVSKAANYLVEGLMLDESSTVHVDLNQHWQSPVWFGAALAAGITITTATDADIVFSDAQACEHYADTPERLVVVSRDPFGMPDRNVPEQFRNASAEVRMYGDHFAPSWEVDAEDIAFKQSGEATTWEQLPKLAEKFARHFDIVSHSRFALAGMGASAERLCLQLVFPLIHDSSVVLFDQISSEDMPALAASEQATKTIRFGQ